MASISSPSSPTPPIYVWGVPFAPWSFSRTLEEIEHLIESGRAAYFMTVNLHTSMLIHNSPAMQNVVAAADFVVADGMPIIWASRLRPRRLPERVAGADLVPAICKLAAAKGYRIFFLGGAPGVGEQAANSLKARFPNVQIVGIESPPYRKTSPVEDAELLDRIRHSRPHILFVALGQPKGEFWVHKHSPSLSGTVCVQIGASLDFLAGKISRAPLWMQRIGLEWLYRLACEPRRLLTRYAQNGLFLARMFVVDAISRKRRNEEY